MLAVDLDWTHGHTAPSSAQTRVRVRSLVIKESMSAKMPGSSPAKVCYSAARHPPQRQDLFSGDENDVTCVIMAFQFQLLLLAVSSASVSRLTAQSLLGVLFAGCTAGASVAFLLHHAPRLLLSSLLKL